MHSIDTVLLFLDGEEWWRFLLTWCAIRMTSTSKEALGESDWLPLVRIGVCAL